MAKPTETKPKSNEAKRRPDNAKSFARHGEGLTSFIEGEEIVGQFVAMKTTEIKDRRTKEKKTIRVYSLMLESGEMARIGSRVLLDDAFDEAAGAYGGVDGLKGKKMSFIRGEDKDLDGGGTLGTYEILVWE